MSGWGETPLPLIGTWSKYGPMGSGGNMFMSSNWTAQLAVYVPMRFSVAIPVKKLWWVNGSNVTGNIDVGIYDSAGNKLVSTGAIAGGTASQIGSADVTDLILPPGEYFFAGWQSSTGRFGGVAFIGGTNHMQITGVRTQASLASGLPSSATMVSPTAGYVPVLGVDTLGIT